MTEGGRWGCGIITNINCVSNELLEPELLSADVNLLSSPALQWVRSRFLCVALSPFPPFSTHAAVPHYPCPPPPPLRYCKVNNVTRSWIAAEYHYQRVISRAGSVCLHKIRYCKTDVRRILARHYGRFEEKYLRYMPVLCQCCYLENYVLLKRLRLFFYYIRAARDERFLTHFN